MNAVVRTDHRLRPRGRHDGGRLLAFLGAHAVPGVESWDGARWSSSIALPGGPGVVTVGRAPGAGFDVTLGLSCPQDQDDALARLRHLLDLDEDRDAVDAQLAADPLLRPLVQRRPGLRVPGTADAFETVVRTVIGQQISVAGARTVTARLVQVHGLRLPPALQAVAPGLTHTFPSSGRLAEVHPDDGSLAMPRSRAAAVVAVAALFAAAGHRPGAAPPGRCELLGVRGVGPWTVDYLDLRAGRHPDVFLPTDLAVRRAVARLGRDDGPRAVHALAERWRPYRSTALLHLWFDYLGL